MIENDRYGFVSGTKDVIRSDLETLLNEYFYIPDGVKIEFDKKGDRFDVKITANGCALRGFNVFK